ncbi:MAG: C4-dicarboxylate ABC transporter [Flavobacteriaceae bacterium]|jgi:hypothetical protein|nr:C4-dicarboxylate ABC transporter [Flavobacteriaceae bacterium]
MKLNNYTLLSAVIGIGYFIIGILVMLYNKFIIELDPDWAKVLGGLFMAYGLFRVYRAVRYIKKKD